MTAYYNEFDPNAAAWLRELIAMGMIADGEVDERSITDVVAADLRGFTQHHFFAGIGVWSYALRNAGWSDGTPICTASLPCQPFSTAGKRLGKQDERHLLPHFLDLIKECGFERIIGEQVPGAIKQGWLDDLHDEMERQGYACGATVLTAAGAGAAHIRQRIYWAAERVAYSRNKGLQGHRRFEQVNGEERRQNQNGLNGESGINSGVADTKNRDRRSQPQQPTSISGETRHEFGGNGKHGRMGNTKHDGQFASAFSDAKAIQQCEAGADSASEFKGAGLSGVVPESIDWIYCQDNKYRPVKSGIAPLVDGIARGVVHSSGDSISPDATSEARVMRLKGYGNAVQAKTAELFVRAFKELLH